MPKEVDNEVSSNNESEVPVKKTIFRGNFTNNVTFKITCGRWEDFSPVKMDTYSFM